MCMPVAKYKAPIEIRVHAAYCLQWYPEVGEIPLIRTK